MPTSQKNAAVVIEAWKLPIFKKHLDAAKYVYTEHTGIAHGTLTLRVSYDWVSELQPVIEAAVKECANGV